jgi:hypothetical protein
MCEICGYSFADNWLLKQHARIHLKEKPFKCTECERRFTTDWQRKSHFETIHEVGKKTFPCNLCDQTFHCRAYLYKHKTWHKLGSNANIPLAKQKKRTGEVDEGNDRQRRQPKKRRLVDTEMDEENGE